MRAQRFPFTTAFWTGSENGVRELRAGKHFWFDLEAANRFCLEDLPARLVDLLRIASSLYVVDRLVKRRRTGSGRVPARTIGVKVEVRDAAFWGQREVRDVIRESVEFVGGDFLDIEFLQDTAPFYGTRRLLPNLHEDASPLVCLYSGGLDSAAGLVARMVESAGRPVLPVTVWHQPRQRHLVRQQLKTLRARFGEPVHPLIVKVAMDWKALLNRDQEEASQRCRAFLFASLGAIAAIMHRQRVVEVFESGIGAINLPLMAGMVGPMATKSAHPKFLRLMSRLASLVAGGPVEFHLPFFDRTKGEVVRNMVEAGLDDLARLTASCVHYPLRHLAQKQCGVCPACVFRREAMTAAGIVEREDTYKHDFLASPEKASRIPSEKLVHLKASMMQVASLRDVCDGMPLPRSVARHIISTEVLPDGRPPEELAALLARYRDEWLHVASESAARGLPWARLLAVPRYQKRGVTNASA